MNTTVNIAEMNEWNSLNVAMREGEHATLVTEDSTQD